MLNSFITLHTDTKAKVTDALAKQHGLLASAYYSQFENQSKVNLHIHLICVCGHDKIM